MRVRDAVFLTYVGFILGACLAAALGEVLVRSALGVQR